MSTIPETISVLEEYSKWRRGDETIPMPDPFEIGVAIGDAVRLLRELAAERERVRVLREQLKEVAAYFAIRELGDPAKLLRNKIDAALAAMKEARK